MMDNLLACETRYRDHFPAVAAINRDGWKKQTSAPRRYRIAVTRVLLALATSITALTRVRAYQQET